MAPPAERSPAGRPTPAGRPRFECFDSLRAIAALSVLFYHASYYTSGLRGSLADYVTQRTAGFPTEGVVIFFAISGFLLYRPFAQARFDGTPGPRIWPYAARRLLRIVPAYWLALIVVTIVLGLNGVFTLHGLGTYFGFLQVYDVRTLDNGMAQAWTLDVELSFYIGLVVLALGLRRVGVRAGRSFLATELGTLLVLSVGSILWQVAWLHWSSDASPRYYPALISLPSSVDLFAVGMGLAVLSVGLAGRRSRVVAVIDRAPWLAWVGAAACWWLLVHAPLLFGGPKTIPGWVIPHELRAALALGLLAPAVFGAPGRGWIRRLLGMRWLRWLGEISYGLYLWHLAVLIELSRHRVPERFGTAAFLVAALSISGALAAASWYGLERYAVGLGRRVGRRPARASAGPGVATEAEAGVP
ncbi:MAG TPA: acyltransferase [Solirubrobacteraceae bacterium]|nr:acyltransferase [Solirubrobacteraceae bacterium]